MKKTKPKYKRLPGRKKTMTGRWSVWQGQDHVLSVRTTWFAEEYTRFYFRDIQAVVIRKTRTGMISNLILVFLTLCFFLFNLANRGIFLFTIPASVFALAFSINIFMGPTCECTILTAVQQRRLHAVSRLKAAARFMAVVRPFIEAAQEREEQSQMEKEVAPGTTDGQALPQP